MSLYKITKIITFLYILVSFPLTEFSKELNANSEALSAKSAKYKRDRRKRIRRRRTRKKRRPYRKRRKKRQRRRRRRPRPRRREKDEKKPSSNFENMFNFDFGHEFAYFLYRKSDKININRGFLTLKNTLKYQNKNRSTIYRFNFNGTAFGGNEFEVKLNSLYLDRVSEIASITIGIQNIAWGETFGFQVADIVCPKDFTDPINSKRLSIPAINYKLLFENLSIQAIYALPRKNKLPDENSPYFPPKPLGLTQFTYKDYESFSDKYYLNDAEWGGKINYLFNFGLDMNLLYYNHWNRNIIYKADFSPSGLTISPVRKRVQTIGMGYTMAFQKIVLRGDGVVHIDNPFLGENIGEVSQTKHYQAIIGVDYTTDNSSNFAIQLHHDFFEKVKAFWASLNFKGDLFKRHIEWQLMVFKGINNNDLWIQPKLTWIILRYLSLSISADFIDSSDLVEADLHKELFPLYKKHDKIYSFLTFRF
jgi:hypothetical protein